MVRALLRDRGAEVQWIFVQRDLAARMLQHGRASGDDPTLLARAAHIMRQPADSEPHDDHMHVRIYCDVGDRSSACTDHGPVRWWKKRWKYMTPPFDRGGPAEGRGGQQDPRSALLELIRTRQPVTMEAPPVTS